MEEKNKYIRLTDEEYNTHISTCEMTVAQAAP